MKRHKNKGGVWMLDFRPGDPNGENGCVVVYVNGRHAGNLPIPGDIEKEEAIRAAVGFCDQYEEAVATGVYRFTG